MTEVLRFKGKNIQPYLWKKDDVKNQLFVIILFTIIFMALSIYSRPETWLYVVIILPSAAIIGLIIIWYVIFGRKEFTYKIDEESVTVNNMSKLHFKAVWKIEKLNLGGTRTLLLHFDPDKLPSMDRGFYSGGGEARIRRIPQLPVALPDKDTEKIEKQIIELVKRNNPNVAFEL